MGGAPALGYPGAMGCRCVRRAVAGAALLAALRPSAAAADEVGFGFHAAYGIAGAFAPADLSRGLRHNLDIAAALALQEIRGSRDGIFSTGKGPMFGASLATGFGEYPTYVVPEVGWGADATIAGLGIMAGVPIRVDPSAGVGLGLRVNVDLILMNLGFRVISVVTDSPELQLGATIGIGRF